MLTGIDHLIVAVVDPDAAADALGSVLGVAPGEGGEHRAWGTRNRIVWLGDTYVELLGVVDATLAAQSWIGAPALAAWAAWPTLLSWAIASDDLEADADRLRAAGADLHRPFAGERRRPDGQVVRWRVSLPSVIAPDRPFLIEHDPTGAEWTPTDRAARASIRGRITSIEVPVDRIAGLARGRGDHRIGTQTLRIAGRAAHEPSIRVEGSSASGSVSMLGCRWLLA